MWEKWFWSGKENVMLQDFTATDARKLCSLGSCSNKSLGGKDSCLSLSRKEKMWYYGLFKDIDLNKKREVGWLRRRYWRLFVDIDLHKKGWVVEKKKPWSQGIYLQLPTMLSPASGSLQQSLTLLGRSYLRESYIFPHFFLHFSSNREGIKIVYPRVKS